MVSASLFILNICLVPNNFPKNGSILLCCPSLVIHPTKRCVYTVSPPLTLLNVSKSTKNGVKMTHVPLESNGTQGEVLHSHSNLHVAWGWGIKETFICFISYPRWRPVSQSHAHLWQFSQPLPSASYQNPAKEGEPRQSVTFQFFSFNY